MATEPLEFLAARKKAREEEVAAQKEALSKLSDEELIAKRHGQVENSEIHVIAVQLLHERQKAREKEAQETLLAAIKKPHWSTTPSFWLLVVSVILTLAGLIKSYS